MEGPMILLTRLNQASFYLNPDLIEHLEATPDTVITMTTGHRYVVREGAEEVVERALLQLRRAAPSGTTDRPLPGAVGLTETVSRVASGALAYMPVVRVGNINRALDELKKAGYWIYGLDERGQELYDQVEFTKPSAIVLGAEGKGLHEQTAKHCDFLVRIPMAGTDSGKAGGVASLNVSVAAGVMLFEWKRRASH